MRVGLFGAGGKVGSVLAPRLRDAGHDVVPLDLRSGSATLGDVDAAVDFTTPAAVEGNVHAAVSAGVACVVGTTGWETDRVDELARRHGVAVLVAPNFAVGAVLMMRFAAEASRYLARAEIVELHNEAKRDAPSGTAKATAARLPGEAPIHSVRLPGLVAHQEVLLADEGQLLTIRHDTLSREAFAPGVLLALDRLHALPAGVTTGLEPILEL